MKSRVAWFAAGSLVTLYASVKAKRAAYRLTPAGLVDQASALGVGWRAFNAEVHHGMTDRERQIAYDLALPLDPGPHELSLHELRLHELTPKEQH